MNYHYWNLYSKDDHEVDRRLVRSCIHKVYKHKKKLYEHCEASHQAVDVYLPLAVGEYNYSVDLQEEQKDARVGLGSVGPSLLPRKYFQARLLTNIAIVGHARHRTKL